MPNLRGSEWLIIVLLVVLLFGAKRLPDAARSIGRSMRIFKAETKGLTDSDAPAVGTVGPAAPAADLPAPGEPAGTAEAPVQQAKESAPQAPSSQA